MAVCAEGRGEGGGGAGLTHLAITDHDRIDGALRARDLSPELGLTILVGQEVRTSDGDLIAVFLEQAIESGRPATRSPRSAPRAASSGSRIRSTGSADRCSRTPPSARRRPDARRLGRGPQRADHGRRGNERAAAFARDHGLPGVAVSDAHSTIELGVAYVVLDGDPSTPGARCPRPRITGRRRLRAGPGRRSSSCAPPRPRRRAGKGLAVRDDERPNQGASASARATPRARLDGTRRRAARPPLRLRSPSGQPRQHRGEKTDSERRSGPIAGRGRRRSDAARRQESVDTDAMSLGRRMRQPRTIISLILPIFLLIPLPSPGFHLNELPALILGANGWLLLAAFVVYYLGFPLRGLRWAILVRGTGYPLRVRDSTEIIFISWLVNCLVPAKLGDVYRAYLLKINSPVSLSRTFGTVFIERVLDLFAIVVLGLAAGYWSFRSGLPTRSRSCSRSASSSSWSCAVGLLTMRNFGRRLIAAAVAAPRPGAVRPLRGGRVRGARAAVAAAARRRHRPDLGDRGDAAVPRRRGARASPTSTSGSAARSSSR